MFAQFVNAGFGKVVDGRLGIGMRSHLTLRSSKSIIETQEKGAKYVQKLTIKTYFLPFSSAFIVDFEQVNVSWGYCFIYQIIQNIQQQSFGVVWQKTFSGKFHKSHGKTFVLESLF